MKPGFAHRRLSTDVLVFQKLGNTILARARPGIEAKQFTQSATEHPPRTFLANFDGSPDAGNHIYRISRLCHDYPLCSLTRQIAPGSTATSAGSLLPESKNASGGDLGLQDEGDRRGPRVVEVGSRFIPSPSAQAKPSRPGKTEPQLNSCFRCEQP